jgi:HEPN domain-containing protein
MSLENLLKTKQLQSHNPTCEAVQRLIQAAARNIADARVSEISGENRFDAAYKAIMQCAMVALWANQYRTSTSQPGHHQTAIQTLPKTIGLEQSTVIVLDALRKQRNVSDYEGDPIGDQALIECIKQAEQLYKVVNKWIATNRPDLM